MYRTILQKLNLIEQDIESIVPVQSDNGDTHYLLTLKKTEHICPFYGSVTSRSTEKEKLAANIKNSIRTSKHNQYKNDL